MYYLRRAHLTAVVRATAKSGSSGSELQDNSLRTALVHLMIVRDSPDGDKAVARSAPESVGPWWRSLLRTHAP